MKFFVETQELQSILISAVTATGVGSIIYGFALVVYRLYFHPLARYPGPFVAKITDLGSVYHQWRGDRHLDFYRKHQKYGPVFRYGPNSLSFNTASATNAIYGTKAHTRKSNLYAFFVPAKGAWSTVNAIPREIHARKRRVLSNAFSDKAVRGMDAFILPQVRTFCDILSDGKEKNMSKVLTNMSFDIMGDMCFGKSFDMQRSEENRFVIDLIEGRFRRGSVIGHYPLLTTFGIEKLLVGNGAASGFQQYSNYAQRQAKERASKGVSEDRKDVFYYLLDATDPETGFKLSMAELWGEAVALIVAGSDTASTALAATFFYLTRPENAAATAKLVAELKEKFTDIEEIKNGPKLNECTYLRACLDESMRLSPPLPGPLPRTVLPGGTIIDNHLIPAGTDVGVPIYALHHNPLYYPEPEKFLPERWLEAEIAEQQNAFMAFGMGNRVCLGKNMAYAEMCTVVARAFWLFVFEAVNGGEGREGIFELVDYLMAENDGPVLRVRRRE